MKATLKRYTPLWQGTSPNMPIPTNTVPSSVMEKDDSG